jgi:hypothetical protein
LRPVIKTIATSVFLSFVGVISAFAQASGSSAELRGQIVDSIGAVVPGAAITITDLAKGSTRSTMTDAGGHTEADRLQPARETRPQSDRAARIHLGRRSAPIAVRRPLQLVKREI